MEEKVIDRKKDKKQLPIFLAVAFLLPYLLGIVMGAAYKKGVDVSVFPNAQMFYPAAGIMLALLVTRNRDELIPKRYFIFYLLVTVAMIAEAIGSVVLPDMQWMGYLNNTLILTALISWILLLTEKKKKREAYGLKGKNWKTSIFCILLFIGIYLLRTGLFGISGGWSGTLTILRNPLTWISLAALPINFFLVYLPFLGEEYGWRYYFQPFLQKKFGVRAGVIVLGILWGLWHLPINFFYYSSPSDGIISVCGQLITCITLGIFFAYAYMKTDNIWVPVILHFLNNNLVPIISGTYSAEVLQNQQINWSDLLPALLVNGVLFGGFLLAKQFREDRFRLPTANERADRAEKI